MEHGEMHKHDMIKNNTVFFLDLTGEGGGAKTPLELQGSQLSWIVYD